MRIGYASEWIGENAGGVERAATDLIHGLLRVDHDNEYLIFCTNRGAYSLKYLEGPRVRLHPTRFNSRWYYVPIGLPLGVLKNPVDVLHATFTIAPWCPARKVVFTVADVTPSIYPEFYSPTVRLRYRWLIARGVARADWITVPSEATKRELVEHYNVADRKISVIFHGVDQRFAQPPSGCPELSLPVGWAIPENFILYVGRFHARKNLDRLLQAFVLLRQDHGCDLKMVLAGRDMWHRKAILERIQSLGLERHVLCPGHVSDQVLELLYLKARVFAFPSLHEGFGIPPVEAMARGLPVMASNCSAMPEILGDAALLVNPLNIEEMAQALYRLVSDESLRMQLIEKGRERASGYSWEAAAAETLKIYYQVLG